MYISGTIVDFASRLHQLPTGVADVNQFLIEGRTYLSSVDKNVSGKWEGEARLKQFQFNQTGSGLYSQQF